MQTGDAPGDWFTPYPNSEGDRQFFTGLLAVAVVFVVGYLVMSVAWFTWRVVLGKKKKKDDGLTLVKKVTKETKKKKKK